MPFLLEKPFPPKDPQRGQNFVSQKDTAKSVLCRPSCNQSSKYTESYTGDQFNPDIHHPPRFILYPFPLFPSYETLLSLRHRPAIHRLAFRPSGCDGQLSAVGGGFG
jgi:hypothetical protein